MNSSDQINELATALAKAQGELENASKSSTNPHFRSKYADLAEVLNTVRPVFARHGLSITQFPSFESGVVSVETRLMHSSGQWLSGVISAPVSKQDAQGVGSATTYCRRYSLAAVAGVAQEDDDANSAVGHGAATQGKADKPWFNKLDEMRAQMKDAVASGKRTPAQIIENLEHDYRVSAKVKAEIQKLAEAEDAAA